jgi:hypothetical protein
MMHGWKNKFKEFRNEFKSKKERKKRQHFELSTTSDEPEKKDQYELKHLG